MRNISKVLRTAYLSALNGLTVNTQSIPVYDSYAPDEETGHYVIITGQRSNEVPVKQNFYNNATVTLDIVTQFQRGGGYEVSEDIADAILAIIRNESELNVRPDFQSVTVTKDSESQVSEIYDDSRIFRTVVSFRHKIKQLTND